MPNRKLTGARFRTPSELREHVKNLDAHFAAETERRSHLKPEEKVAENFSTLCEQLDRNPSLLLALQPTPPGRMAQAKCYAPCCVFSEEGRKETIRDDYRIVVLSAITQYFHIECLEEMPGLAKLAPTRFKLDTTAFPWNNHRPWHWGFSLDKWFEHSGCIDLEKFKDYRKALEKYDEELSNSSTQWIEWQLKYDQQHMQHGESCGCPPRPEESQSQEPILRDYLVSEDRACPLSAVIECE